MEDFQVLGNIEPIKKAFKFGLKNPESEVFGFFIHSNKSQNYEFIEGKNLDSFYKNHFISNDNFFYDCYLSNKIISIFHTHIDCDPKPSPIDIEISKSLGLPSFIFSLKNKNTSLYYPESYSSIDLFDRDFIPLFQDCVTFAKDFYLKVLNINLLKNIKNWARYRSDPNEDFLKIVNENFNEVEISKINYGDLIVFKPNESILYHVGVFLGENYFAHHPLLCKPKKEILNEEWVNKVYKVYRHKDL